MKGETERRWHNIQKNETTRIPRRHIFLDSEARVRRVKDGYVQSWRLACASFATWGKRGAQRRSLGQYTTPETLWNDVSEFTRKGSRTVLWAHNLGYDIRITQGLETLPRLGWKLVAHNINKSGAWFDWRKDGATLIMADSTSVYGNTLAKVGEWFGIGKIKVDAECDDDEIWMKRCIRDVEILETAIVAYLQWLDNEDMGNWQLTSAGQSWASYRHKFLTHKLVVHDDERALAAERRAMWAGRCEAYWHGELRSQVVHEWDFAQAYARIAQKHSVPVRLIGPMPPAYDWRRIIDSSQSCLLAKVRITTSVPVVPASHDGRIVWPIGSFETTLWDVEIRAALDAGATVEVLEGWLYALRPALKDWAEWVISELESPEEHCPVWRKSILKHWSRALIGRMAMTYNSWEEFGTMPDSRVRYSQYCDIETDKLCDMVQIGHDVWIDGGRVESANSMPMITGYIQAIARVQLWQLISNLPREAVLYVDTDSLLCTDKYSAMVEDTARKLGLTHLRLKRSWDGFSIRGPRQIITGKLVRVSGVPRNALRSGNTTFTGEVWDSLPQSLRTGHAGRVVIRERKWNILGTDSRRDSMGIGWTTPKRLRGAEQ